ncbi:hypothetical protein [Piscinibacter sp. XHJ-5]|uniref:hypothetical protein n=1 Tax=Piscinibacter sp. XHJ-5 TaxID=3037797 RepID=UPI0024529CE5|nr:hypothetical protein [Piscinibacter sp. XHJ-5]
MTGAPKTKIRQAGPSTKGAATAPAIALARSAAFAERVRQALSELLVEVDTQLSVSMVLAKAGVNRTTLYSRRKDAMRSHVHQKLIDEIDTAIAQRAEKIASKGRRSRFREEVGRPSDAPDVAALANELIKQRDAAEAEEKRRKRAERRERDAVMTAYTYAIALRQCWRVPSELPRSLSDFISQAEAELQVGDQGDLEAAAVAGAHLASDSRGRPPSDGLPGPAGASVTPLRRTER